MRVSVTGIFPVLGFAAAGLPAAATALSFSPLRVPSIAKRHQPERTTIDDCRRREALKIGVRAAAAVFTSGAVVASGPVHAFENAIPDAKLYADKPKRRGNPPKDLGVLKRTTEGEDETIIAPGLRTCDGNPNCFSTTGDYLLSDRVQKGVDFLIQPWAPPADERKPLRVVADAVRAYVPGGGGIDGGGFSVEKETDSYLYYRFESLKKSYIDDVEFATTTGGKILVRSASRVGQTDFGVNAIRLNTIAAGLRSKGWTIAEITPETHRDYWGAAITARDGTFDSTRRDLAGGEEGRFLTN